MVRTFRERWFGGNASAAQNGSSLFGFLQETGSVVEQEYTAAYIGVNGLE